jgi:multiple sugar transport system substrate-binding protein
MSTKRGAEPRPTRRDLFRSAGVLALGGALAGCGSVRSGFTGSPVSPNVLTYWNLLGGGDGVRMKAMEAVYQKANPDVRLQASTLTWGNPYYTKLSLATLGAQPPDVAISHLTRVPTLVGADLLEPFETADLERFEMTPDRFVKRAIDGATIDGKLYAVPLDTHPFVMFYNTEICEKAGLLGTDGELAPIEGAEAFVEALTKAKEVTKAWGGSMSTIADPATDWRMFFTLYSQLGGKVLQGTAPEEIVEADKALEALTFMQSLTAGTKVMPTDIDYGGAVALFANQRAGFYFEGEWEVSTFLTQKMPFSMTRIPQIFGTKYAVQADSHTFVMPRRRDPDPERLDRTYTFIRSMLDQSLAWAEGGHVPTWLPTQEDPDYSKLKPQSNYAAVAESAVYDPPAWFSGSGSNFENIAGAAIGEVLTGRLKPDAAVKRIQQGISKLALTPAPI